MNNFKELKIWNKSMDLVVKVYEATAVFPAEEKYGLTSQIRRCAVSVPSNIAEGAGRNSNGEFRQFLGISNGSSYELQTQLILSGRLKLLDENIANQLVNEIEEIQKMNYNFKRVKNKSINKYSTNYSILTT